MTQTLDLTSRFIDVHWIGKRGAGWYYSVTYYDGTRFELVFTGYSIAWKRYSEDKQTLAHHRKEIMIS